MLIILILLALAGLAVIDLRLFASGTATSDYPRIFVYAWLLALTALVLALAAHRFGF